MSRGGDVRWTVSVKGVVRDGQGRVLLARNERDEWELPGGQLEVGESPEQCVERELLEETGLVARAGRPLGASVFEVVPGALVLILGYLCAVEGPTDTVCSDEHHELGFFADRELDDLRLPAVYRTLLELAGQL